MNEISLSGWLGKTESQLQTVAHVQPGKNTANTFNAFAKDIATATQMAEELEAALKFTLVLAEKYYKTLPDDGSEQDYYRPQLDAAKKLLVQD